MQRNPWTSIHIPPRWLIMTVCLAAGWPGLAWGQVTPAPPPDATTFSDVVPRDRRWIVLLTNASNHLKANRITEGLELLQRCFDAPEDAYVLRSEWEQPTSRGIATRLLQEGGEAVWKQYETLFGPIAEQALKAVETDATPGGYQAVIRKYRHTKAGAVALDKLASWHLDRGDFEAAVNCWEQVLKDPVHESRVSPIQRMKLIVAANRCGRTELARIQLEMLGKTRITVAGQSLSAPEWQTRLKGWSTQISSSFDWRLLGGAPERRKVTAGSTPFLLRPSVTWSMFDGGAIKSPNVVDQSAMRDGRLQFEKDLETALASGTVISFAGSPIVNGDLIVWRDAFGIRAIDRTSRQMKWSYPTATRLHSLLVYTADVDVRSRQGQATYRQNSVLEQLTSDGRHVYVVDDNNIPDRAQAQFLFDQGELTPRPDGTVPVAAWNRLIAIRMQSASRDKAEAWRIGGHPTQEPSAVLSGHFFLGPPLPVGGLLYAVAEYQKQIWLIALNPDNGGVAWRQTLSLAPQPSRESPLPVDKMRLTQACLMAASQGVIVCPLGSGLLVGADQITGNILWAYDYRTRRKTPTIQYTPLGHNAFEQFNEGDFSNPPLIHEGRVYFLAPGDNVSDQVVCLDLISGRKVWQVDALDLRYLATVGDGLVVGVGAGDAVGLSMENGSMAWTKRVPRISGVGATLPGIYLLPAADGRVISLALHDGSEVGFAMQAPSIRPGNLVVSGRDVLSLNGLDLQVFPQSADLLASLEARPPEQRGSYQFWFELGELQFRMGQVATAKASLRKAMSLIEPAAQAEVRGLLRELAWHEMRQQPERRPAVLTEYAALCDLPEHRAQLLLLEGEEQLRAGQLDRARSTAQALLGLRVSEPLRLLTDPDRRLTASVWVTELAKRVETGPPHATADITAETVHDLFRDGDRNAILEFLQQHPNTVQSATVRLGLARLLTRDGQSQAAELLVWQDHSRDDQGGLEACRFLLELWEAAGLYEDSGYLLHQIGTRLGSVKASDGMTGHEFYSQYPRDRLAWSAAQRFVPPDWKVENVTISEEHEIDLKLRNTFNSAPRYLYAPRTSQQLVQRGQTLPNALQQIDSETGSVIADITLPVNGGPAFFPYFDVRQRLGHFMPLGGASNCYGVSLLERGLVWNRSSTPQLRLNNVVRVGPCSPDLCIFRTRDRLLGLNPVTGEVLWERNDLEEISRGNANAITAIPGDAEVILVMESDTKAYRVYKTADGSFLRQGKLTNCYYIHQQFGRNLLYATEQSLRNVQLWDPLTDKVLFEGTQMSAPAGIGERDPEFTVADTNGQIRVVNGLNGDVKLRVNLNPLAFQPPQQPPQLKAFSDGTRYYLNVYRQLQVMGHTTFPTDAIFPTQQITGDLHAIDPRTSEILWTRSKISPQNIVHLTDYRLPFIVSLSRWRGPPRGNSQTSLRIEVIDGATGRTLVVKNNAYNDRLLLSDYDRTAGRLRFRGAVTQLQLDFGPTLNRPIQDGDDFVVRP